MEIITKTTLDMLTEDSVSVLTQRFLINEDGTEEQIGLDHRKAYSIEDEADLEQEVPEPYLTSVLTAWHGVPVEDVEEEPEEETTEVEELIEEESIEEEVIEEPVDEEEPIDEEPEELEEPEEEPTE